MTMLAGSVPMPMIVSEVWNSIPDSAMTGGTAGRAPVATTMRSAVTCVRPSMTSSRGPRKRARPSNSVTPSASARARRPFAETCSMRARTRSCIAFQSTPPSSAPMPSPAAWRTPSATSAVCTNILLGMQPRLRQVPPKAPDSMSATGPGPGSFGTRLLPEPDPMMAREKCCTLES